MYKWLSFILGQAEKTEATPEIGDVMKDSTIYAGISPDTGKAMYVAPSDAPLCMKFHEAAAYAKNLKVRGKKDFRVPSVAELKVLFLNRERGTLKGTFNLPGESNDGWYWSSTPGSFDGAFLHRFSDGELFHSYRSYAASVRCVR